MYTGINTIYHRISPGRNRDLSFESSVAVTVAIGKGTTRSYIVYQNYTLVVQLPRNCFICVEVLIVVLSVFVYGLDVFGE